MTVDRFVGEAPAVQYLVDGVIALGISGMGQQRAIPANHLRFLDFIEEWHSDQAYMLNSSLVADGKGGTEHSVHFDILTQAPSS
ncbi:hypothetical protein GFM02_09080 [Rhizobium leguminosarum bv. viciae]|uniref:hypothetical protein n=1 Tax=Rhizobium leguminosarum TaxID=384 RepID=UPI0014410E43|nr:hypothetical protein [Rhizobium leguminosarum]NKK98422.1 hypothetical protein [Rhizobium leguminosarum bv. viciae]